MSPELSNYSPPPRAELAHRDEWLDKRFEQSNFEQTGDYFVVEPMGLDELPERYDTHDTLTDLFYKDRENSADAHYEYSSRTYELIESGKDLTPGAVALEAMRQPAVVDYLSHRKFAELEKAHANLEELVPTIGTKIIEGVADGVKKGYIPENVDRRIGAALRKTETRIVADEALQVAGADDNVGVYSSELNIVGFRPSEAEDTDMAIRTGVHEFSHQLSGGTFIKNTSTDDVARNRVGFSNDLEGDRTSKEGLNEAITEHLACAMLDGDFETLDPDKRSSLEDKFTYYNFRKLTAAFVENSGGRITVKMLTNAYFEDTGGSEGSLSARKELIRGVVEAYGYGALKKFEKLCEGANPSNGSTLNRLMSRIHPPQLDGNGTIMKSGWIDTEDLDVRYNNRETLKPHHEQETIQELTSVGSDAHFFAEIEKNAKARQYELDRYRESKYVSAQTKQK